MFQTGRLISAESGTISKINYTKEGGKMELPIEEISKEIQNILAKHNITVDLIGTVLSKSCDLIKLRTEVKSIN